MYNLVIPFMDPSRYTVVLGYLTLIQDAHFIKQNFSFSLLQSFVQEVRHIIILFCWFYMSNRMNVIAYSINFSTNLPLLQALCLGEFGVWLDFMGHYQKYVYLQPTGFLLVTLARNLRQLIDVVLNFLISCLYFLTESEFITHLLCQEKAYDI